MSIDLYTLIPVLAAIMLLAACDGGPIYGGDSSAMTVSSVMSTSSRMATSSAMSSNSAATSSSAGTCGANPQNQTLASLNFADDALKTCVMATGKVMSDEVTELACAQPISDLSGIEQLNQLESFEPQQLDMQVVDMGCVPQLKKLELRGSMPQLVD